MDPDSNPVEPVRYQISIDPLACDREGLCVQACAWGVFVQAENGAVPDLPHPENCSLCGHCIAVCPEDAITHSGLLGKNFPLWDRETLPDNQELQVLFRSRRSVRNYNSRRRIAREDLEMLLDAARYAPTGSNLQLLEYIVISDVALIKQLSNMTLDVYQGIIQGELADPGQKREQSLLVDLLVEAKNGADPIFYSAPLLVIIHAPNFTPCPLEDASLAAHQFMLAAHAMGLGSCLIANFYKYVNQSTAIRDLLSIPGENDIVMSFTLGYPSFRYRRMVDRKPVSVEWH
jgi:nitroreductase/NAD-dependent dihydropyrimidine dehydrogenase PreA subunit